MGPPFASSLASAPLSLLFPKSSMSDKKPDNAREMAANPPSSPGKPVGDAKGRAKPTREEKLAAALKANIKRRKAAAKSPK